MTREIAEEFENWDSNLLIKLLKRLSLKECYEYLMNGYLKENTRNSSYNIYPFVLQQLSIKYFGNIFMRFKKSLTSNTQITLINEHYAKMESSKEWTTTLLIDFPIPCNDNSINLKWNLQIKGNNLPNGHYFIGIVEDKYKSFNSSVWNLLCFENYGLKIYGVFGFKGRKLRLAWNGKRVSCESNKYGICGPSYFGNNDIISVEYHGKLKQLKLINVTTKQLIYLIKLKSSTNSYWYPAISLRDPGDSVRIL